MSQAIIYSFPSGLIDIVYPNPLFNLTAEQHDMVDAPVMLTEDGIIDGQPVKAGAFFRKLDAVRAEIDFSELPKEIVDISDIPEDDTFRKAWRHDTSASAEKIALDFEMAAEMATDYRRKLRSAQFMPIDGDNEHAVLAPEGELLRQPVRDENAVMQDAIEAARMAKDEVALKAALGPLGHAL